MPPSSRRLLHLLAAVLGLSWLLAKGGAKILGPRSTAWLMCEDWSWHHLGWLFYHRDRWRFPLGKIGNFVEPSGTGIVYVDAIPWAAMLSKLLPVGAPDFQYLGPWIGLSYALQASFGAAIVALYTRRALHALLGGLLFLVTPVLVMRTGHAALTAHWTLLCALFLYLRPCETKLAAERTLRLATVLVVLVAGIHAYLVAMVVPMILALHYRLFRVDRLVDGRGIAIATARTLGLLGVAMAIIGYFDGTGPTDSGYGIYSADLLAPFNPMGWSRWLPAMPSGPGQIEGFAYLGLGVLLMLVVVAVRAPRPSSWSALRPLVVVVALLFVYALSLRVTIAGRVLFASKFDFFTLANVFRSSGRFVWPLHYLLLTAAIVGIVRLGKDRPGWVTGAFVLVLVLQVAEQSHRRPPFGTGQLPIRPPDDARWKLSTGRYRTMVVYPPSGSRIDAVQYPPHHAVTLGYLANQLHMSIDMAVVARGATPDAYIDQVTREVEAGGLRGDVVYLVDAAAIARVRPHARCGSVDGLHVCVAGGNVDPFATALADAR